MTTYQEISSSQQLNFDYWSEQACFYLACYKERKDLQQTVLAASSKRAFLKAMQSRRDQEYLK